MTRPLILAPLCMAVIVATSACAPARGWLAPHELRQTFGTIAVTTGGAEMRHGFQRPITSGPEGAARAVRAVGGQGATTVAGALIDPRLIIVLPLLPFVVTGAAIGGALAAESPDVVTTGAVALGWAVKELDFDTILQDRLRDQLAERGGYDVVFREPAVGEPIATLLLISVTSVRLSEGAPVGRGGSVNPRLYLQIVATMEVLERDERGASRLRDRRELSSVSGRARIFRDWAADDARAFREQVREELDELAEKIADTLLRAPHR